MYEDQLAHQGDAAAGRALDELRDPLQAAAGILDAHHRVIRGENGAQEDIEALQHARRRRQAPQAQQAQLAPPAPVVEEGSSTASSSSEVFRSK